MKHLHLLPRRHRQAHPSDGSVSLRDVILGGQDGLVNVLGIVLGISAASSNIPVLLAAGLAATFAESTSMAAVAYTSSLADRDRYAAERERLLAAIRTEPEEQREAVRTIYADKGFAGALLDQITTTITANEQTWLDTLLHEQLNLRPVDTAAVLRSAVVVGAATLVGSLIPLAPFFLLPRVGALVAAVAISAVVLFAVGAYKAESTIGDWKRSGLQMLAIGLGAAAIAFLVGRIFNASG
jgi:vacuolar iron transporter family protein